MKKTKLFGIRCIAEESKGYGNLSRCLTLARFLRKKGHRSIFIINKNHSAINQIKKSKFQYIIIPTRFIYKKELLFFYDIQKKFEFDAIIIDAREFSQKISKDLTKLGTKIILIDDAWCKKAYADIIFNVTIIKQYQKYNIVNRKSKLFVGSKYFLTQPEFKKYRKNLSDIKEKKRFDVVISMGGSDSNQLSLKIAKSILGIPNIRIKIIKGPFFKNSRKLQNLAKINKRIIIKNCPYAIWKDFNKADVVIASAGSTLFELAIQRVPSICIATTKHQIPYAKQFVLDSFVINLGYWRNISYSELNDNLNAILKNTKRRKQMCLAGGKMLDGYGLQRVTNIINSLIKGN